MSMPLISQKPRKSEPNRVNGALQGKERGQIAGTRRPREIDVAASGNERDRNDLKRLDSGALKF